MLKSMDKLRTLIKKYRTILRGEKQIALVKVMDETSPATDLRPPEEVKPRLPEPVDAFTTYPDMQTRSIPDADATYNPGVDDKHDLAIDLEIDLSRDDQFEAYANGMQIPQKTLEQWISAGILCPDEVRAAEKLLKMIRTKARRRLSA